MKTYVSLSSRWISSRRLTTCAWTETSSADTGSSATMSAGDSASARATPMRWRWPPENWRGIPARVVPGQPDPLEQRRHAVGHLALGALAVGAQDVADDRPDALARVQGRVGILEDHLHLAAQGPQLAVAAFVMSRPSKGSGRSWASSRRSMQRPRVDLAAARLADEAERLALHDVQGHAVHRVDDVAAPMRPGLVVLDEILQSQQGLLATGCSLMPASWSDR
jgi:hypothetical protein